MKKILVAIPLAILLGVGLVRAATIDGPGNFPNVLSAEVLAPAGTGDTGALRTARKGKVLYDSGVVAAGAQITIPVLDLTGFEHITIYANNSDGAATRVLTARVYLDDGTTQIHAWAFTAVPVSSTSAFTMGPSATLVAGIAGAIAVALPNKLGGTYAAGGSSNGRVTIYGR